MPRGRPPLRIGAHGKIARISLGNGMWLARCRFRDEDGVVRIVERQTPPGKRDQYGAAAEAELLGALELRRAPNDDDIDGDTRVSALCRLHLQNLEELGRSEVTLDTYRYTFSKLEPKLGALRVSEASAGRVDKALKSMMKSHGATMTRQAKAMLRGALQLAVTAEAIDRNPVVDASPISSGQPPKGAPAVSAEQLVSLLTGMRTSEEAYAEGRTVAEYCRDADLVDPVTLFVGTGLRRSEVMALRWVDIDDDTNTAHIRGKVIRVNGVGLVRKEYTKTAAGMRTIPLPEFVMDMLKQRRDIPRPNDFGVIFPSTTGTLRDPSNFGKQWRKVRGTFGLPEVTSHSFRKALATLIDDAALSARIGADHLGHRHVSMTQDRYFGRGRQHPEVAAVLDRALAHKR